MDLTFLVTKEDIYKLARDNHIIAHVVNLHEHSGLDWTVCLAYAVKVLAQENQEKTKMLLKHMHLCTPPISLEELNKKQEGK